MSETPDIEILQPEEAIDTEEKPARNIGFKTLGIAALIAALMGTIGGAGLSTFFNKAGPDITPVQTRVELLAKENAALKAQISILQNDIKSVPKPKSVDLSSIRKRLKALETAEPQVINPELITRLEALQSEGSEVLDLSDIYARLETLENRPAVIQESSILSSSKEMKAETPISFPKAKILASLEEDTPSKSWLQKTLKKHISVQSEDNPYYLVELIETDIENGDIDSAIAKFDKLPNGAKTIAQDWHAALKGQ